LISYVFFKAKIISLENIQAPHPTRLASVMCVSIARNNWQRSLLTSATMLRFFQINQLADFRRGRMKRLKAFLGASIPLALGVVFLGATSQSASAACQLNSPGGQIKRVVSITFDNVHLRRDNPDVPSDLEQMPNLLNFIQNNGTISGNHHTPLISHTATDILTTLTGVYGERMGIPVANSYGFFRADGSVGFNSSFLYWTAVAADGKPEMVNELGKTAPAPWVPFTRAGCDVGAFSVANIEFESVPADVNTVFGPTSQEGIEANDPKQRDKANADFLGIAIHCAHNSPLCNNAQAKDDLLVDEPGGYVGFKALFGNFHVQPVISPTGPVKDLDGNVIQTAAGNPGFPNIFSPLATQSLGYAATMLEAGVQVVYLYIADAHDNHAGFGTFGPGEAGYVAQLKSYDAAFGKFFARLAADGITKDNTLFVVVPDENDHFVGGTPSPAHCDGVNVPCTYATGQKGEIDAFLDRLVVTQRANNTAFLVHSDDAPTVYITGNPAPTAPVTRTLEHDLNALVVTNPETGNTDKLSRLLADQAEMKLLHMVTASAARTPTFTMFGNDNYFFETGNGSACASQSDCVFVGPGFAWNHGDFQRQITRTWAAMVGPGVRPLGRHDDVFSDHTDVRPTLLALLGLKDSYVHDGRVLSEWLEQRALPSGIRQRQENFVELAEVYKQLNAPLGELGRASLVYANRSITDTNKVYARYLDKIEDITEERNRLANDIKAVLDAAAFHNHAVDEDSEDDLGRRAKALIDRVKDLAQREHHDED
jgi:arylsulfatase A-like enzyme